MMTLMVEAKGLVKRYGERVVVNGLDLTVEEGEVLAIIGPNGAGKSTTLDMILGIKRPDAGSVMYWREDAKRQIGVRLQATPFFPGYTALENLRMFAVFYGLRPTNAELMEHLKRFNLHEAAHIDASRLSGGQQKKLAIAMALLHRQFLRGGDQHLGFRRSGQCPRLPAYAADPARQYRMHERDWLHRGEPLQE